MTDLELKSKYSEFPTEKNMNLLGPFSSWIRSCAEVCTLHLSLFHQDIWASLCVNV